jgi:hypothetical protein
MNIVNMDSSVRPTGLFLFSALKNIDILNERSIIDVMRALP